MPPPPPKSSVKESMENQLFDGLKEALEEAKQDQSVLEVESKYEELLSNLLESMPEEEEQILKALDRAFLTVFGKTAVKRKTNQGRKTKQDDQAASSSKGGPDGGNYGRGQHPTSQPPPPMQFMNIPFPPPSPQMIPSSQPMAGAGYQVLTQQVQSFYFPQEQQQGGEKKKREDPRTDKRIY